jgi:hypothetical protein
VEVRKALLYLGLTILLLGVAFLIISSIKNVEQRRIGSSTASWETSANLTKGSTYIFDIWASSQWGIDFSNGGYETEQPVDVVMVSPGGGETKLQAFFYAPLASSGSPYRAPNPSYIYTEYGTVDSDSFDVDKSYRAVRFTVKQGGNYTAHVVKETLNWTTGPPSELILYQEVIPDESSYSVFLQGGGGVCLLAGVVVLGWGVTATKKVGLRQKNRATK